MEISRYYRYRNCLKRNDNSSETNYFNLGTNDLNTVKKECRGGPLPAFPTLLANKNKSGIFLPLFYTKYYVCNGCNFFVY